MGTKSIKRDKAICRKEDRDVYRGVLLWLVVVLQRRKRSPGTWVRMTRARKLKWHPIREGKAIFLGDLEHRIITITITYLWEGSARKTWSNTGVEQLYSRAVRHAFTWWQQAFSAALHRHYLYLTRSRASHCYRPGSPGAKLRELASAALVGGMGNRHGI